MSRTPTPDELRQVYAELKRQGLSRYDYDELVRIDSQGRLLMTTDVANASKAACQAIKASFKQLTAFQIVAVNCQTTGNNWLQQSLTKHNKPYVWALYLEIDDNTEHADLFLDGYDAVSKYIPELDNILRVAHLNGVDISKQNVHADIRGKQHMSAVNEAKIPEVPEKWYSKITAQMIEDYWPLKYVADYFAEVLNGTTSLNEARDNLLSFIPEYESNKWNQLKECDGGGAGAGGDASGAAGGDAGGAAASTGDAATSTADVLGDCHHDGKNNDGYMGPGCFHMPMHCMSYTTRYGGSIRPKKKKKQKKHALRRFIDDVKVIEDYDDLVSEEDFFNYKKD